MATATTSELHAKLHEAIGAVDILFLLREEWLVTIETN